MDSLINLFPTPPHLQATAEQPPAKKVALSGGNGGAEFLGK